MSEAALIAKYEQLVKRFRDNGMELSRTTRGFDDVFFVTTHDSSGGMRPYFEYTAGTLDQIAGFLAAWTVVADGLVKVKLKGEFRLDVTTTKTGSYESVQGGSFHAYAFE